MGVVEQEPSDTRYQDLSDALFSSGLPQRKPRQDNDKAYSPNIPEARKPSTIEVHALWRP